MSSVSGIGLAGAGSLSFDRGEGPVLDYLTGGSSGVKESSFFGC